MNNSTACSVLVDGVVFENTVQIGIRRVFYEIMRRAAHRVNFSLWLRNRPVAPIPPGVQVLRDRGRATASRWNLPGRAYLKWARGRYPAEVCRNAIFHSTYFTRCPVQGPLVVVSVYDMIAETAFAYSGGDAWAANIKEKEAAIQSATLCIAISESTAAELVRFYPNLAGRVRVVPLGANHLAYDTRFLNTLQPRSRESFALFVGHRHGYKNFKAALDGVSSSLWPTNLKLFVVGTPFTEPEQRLIDVLGLKPRIRDLGHVSDADLRCLYSAAKCFIYPSMCEGFGLPLLEAQINDCPVVCSDIPVFREVAGKSARFFDPRLGERLAEAVAEVCEPDVRRCLIEAGRLNVLRFQWDKTAAGYASIYEELIASANAF